MKRYIRDRINSLSLEIGSKLKKLRIEKGLTQKGLAAKIHNGVDYTYIGKLERGQQLPSLKVLLGISETFSVPIGYFFREVSETNVCLNSPVELGDIMRHEKGGELLHSLQLLHSNDMSLIVEIIHILNRHRGLETSEGNVSTSEGLLIPLKRKSSARKEKY